MCPVRSPLATCGCWTHSVVCLWNGILNIIEGNNQRGLEAAIVATSSSHPTRDVITDDPALCIFTGLRASTACSVHICTRTPSSFGLCFTQTVSGCPCAAASFSWTVCVESYRGSAHSSALFTQLLHRAHCKRFPRLFNQFPMDEHLGCFQTKPPVHSYPLPCACKQLQTLWTSRRKGIHIPTTPAPFLLDHVWEFVGEGGGEGAGWQATPAPMSQMTLRNLIIIL